LVSEKLLPRYLCIVGETYEAHLEDGTEIYMEQTTHHPPASNWEVFGPKKEYHYWGTGIWAASCTGNTVKGYVHENLLVF